MGALSVDLGKAGLYGAALSSPRAAERAFRQWPPAKGVDETKEEIYPAGTSVGKTKGRAGEVFRRPLRLPWRFPIVALRAQESHWEAGKASKGEVSKETTRPRPTTLGAASSWVTTSRGK
jgi:hypothetical protein